MGALPHPPLPLRCDMIGLTKTEASNLMTIIGIMGIFIRPVMGHLADQPWMNRVVMFGTASVLTGILTGVSTQVYSFSGLAVTSALFGLLSGRLKIYVLHIYGLVQERRSPSALAMGLRLSCTNPPI